MQSGAPFAHELDFSTGLPTGAVVYSVLGDDGIPLTGYDAVPVTVGANTLSIVITVPGIVNTCSKPLFETRTIAWAYPTAHGIVEGSVRYRVEKIIPFPVTEEGVRAKLGIEPHELEDNAIDLLMAYASINQQFDLTPFVGAGDYTTLIVLNAIEAQAALDVLPSLQLAIAKAEDSGTNKYQRFNSIDWDALAGALNDKIARLENLVGVDPDKLVGSVIFLAVGATTDRVTNTQYGG